MMEFKKTTIEGVFEIINAHHEDERGSFTKVFQSSEWLKNDLAFELKESYFSISQKDVIRGMHFQLPPHEHSKIVYCPKGSILDVIVDLRESSPTYGHNTSRILSESKHNGFFIPVGCAHGFKSLEDGSMTVYLVSSEYNRDADTGIRWDSFGFDWNCAHSVHSSRDLTFKSFEEFDSPFVSTRPTTSTKIF